MAICDLCNQEMTSAASCTVDALHLRGQAVPAVPHRVAEGWRRCGDCGVEPDGFHHLGCDMQDCPRCGRQLLSCGCPWAEWGEDDDPDDEDLGDESDLVEITSLLPLGAAAAPLRATYHPELRQVAAWALAHGRPCDLDVVALCFPALDWLREPDGLRLDRPDVNGLVYNRVPNEASIRRTVLPDDWPVHLWTLVSWLHDTGRIVAGGDCTLPVLLEPLQCYGGLGPDGRLRPPGVDVDFACQCYVPHDPSCPPGLSQHIVAYDRSGHPIIVRARLRPRSAPTDPACLRPLRALLHLVHGRPATQPELDEFVYLGCTDADGRVPSLSLYSHLDDQSGHRRNLTVDPDGVPWQVKPDRRFRAGFRWAPVQGHWRPRTGGRDAVRDRA